MIEYNTENSEQTRLITREQFETLYKITQTLNAVNYQETLIEETLDLVIKVLDAERGLFVKYNEDGGEFKIIAARNIGQESISDLSSFSSGILRKVIEKKEPMLYHDVQSDPHLSQFESVQLHNITSVLGVPIFHENKIWGVLLVDSRVNRKEFTDENLVFLDFFSNLVSLALERIIQYEKLQDENTILKNQLQSKDRIDEFVGESKAMYKLFELIHKVAKTDATVLIYGESGTGKELVAKAIHNLSNRNGQPYLAQFCGSIPDTLLESELFGYKKGAFTGANSDKKGLFEVANGGTFFLDEIADISPALQAKLLRVLQNKEIIRLGDTEVINVDVRVIAATNKDLKVLSKEDKFRQDLFYRLNVFPLNIPPLRERKSDISLLVKHFFKKFSDKEIHLDPKVLTLLESYSWPGNVRQLENVIQRALILCDGNKLLAEHVIIEEDDEEVDFRGSLKEIEKKILLKRLKEYDGNKTLTAKSLGVSVRWVQLKIKDLGEEN